MTARLQHWHWVHHAAATPTVMDADDVIHRLRHLHHRLSDDGDSAMSAHVLAAIALIEQQQHEIDRLRRVSFSVTPRADSRSAAAVCEKVRVAKQRRAKHKRNGR
jgi:hypothetical protein